ncbi:6-phospho-beta-glucosidase [Brachybacterium sp. Marseille-Q7125]|uniref:family 4 glycosyl hydrolase n=1 Tax=Brachybacterium sp. Marseille-Q7125 TaxID=2932815 RepID=UPI001FF185FD
MKLTILGGGGFRVPLVYEAVATAATGLTVNELVLHDVDPGRLRTITAVIEGLGEQLTAEGRAAALPRLQAATSVDEAVAGADFVFSAIRVGGSESRTIDERVALGLGLLGQETVGPGGLAYALRTIPVAMEIAQAIAQGAPEAWVINFTNPAGIVTEAMRTVLGDRVVGICDTPIGLVRRVGRLLGTDIVGDRAATFDYVGLNHLGWLRSVTIDGQDRLPEVLGSDDLLEEIEEARIIGKDWVRADGALPNEYLYYYLHTDDAISRITSAATTRGEFLAKQQGDFYLSALEAVDGRPAKAGASRSGTASTGGSCCSSPLGLWQSALHEREATYMAETRDEARREEDIAGGGYQEVAMRLMTAIATGRQERMILDVGNAPAGSDAPAAQRIVPVLPADTVIEVLCEVDEKGVHPQPVGQVELGRLGLMSTLRAAERSICEAARTGSRDAAWQGFSTHPLVSSPQLGAKLLEGYEAGHPQIAALLTH